jgi:hypothetical protein
VTLKYPIKKNVRCSILLNVSKGVERHIGRTNTKKCYTKNNELKTIE